jgi:hypothetical protein
LFTDSYRISLFKVSFWGNDSWGDIFVENVLFMSELLFVGVFDYLGFFSSFFETVYIILPKFQL